MHGDPGKRLVIRLETPVPLVIDASAVAGATSCDSVVGCVASEQPNAETSVRVVSADKRRRVRIVRSIGCIEKRNLSLGGETTRASSRHSREESSGGLIALSEQWGRRREAGRRPMRSTHF